MLSNKIHIPRIIKFKECKWLLSGILQVDVGDLAKFVEQVFKITLLYIWRQITHVHLPFSGHFCLFTLLQNQI